MGNPRHLRRKEKLMRLFDKHGLRPHTRRGQNFLLDKNQVLFIARCGEVQAGDIVLEVGPGTGFLTSELLPTGATVLAVELDHGLAQLVRGEFADAPNLILMEGDILAGKNEINPDVLARLQAILEARPGATLKAVSNLPYSAGTPFTANLFHTALPWSRAVFLLQLEVAERLVAAPGTPAYGALSIVAQLGGRVRIERKVPPQVFWPRPKVASAIVGIDFYPVEQRLSIPWKPMRRVTVAVFNSRRKNLRNALKGLFGKEDVDARIAEAGLDPEIRGEQLPAEGFLALAHVLERHEA